MLDTQGVEKCGRQLAHEVGAVIGEDLVRQSEPGKDGYQGIAHSLCIDSPKWYGLRVPS